MKFNATIKDFREILNKEVTFQKSHVDSNTNKKLSALKVMDKLLKAVPSDLKIKNVESTKNNGKYIRDFEMFNLGSLAECILGYYARPYIVKTMSKSNKSYDWRKNKHNYEFKASLSATSKNTPINFTNDIYLINQLGVWYVDLEAQKVFADKYGRLPHNDCCGVRETELSEMLGF